MIWVERGGKREYRPSPAATEKAWESLFKEAIRMRRKHIELLDMTKERDEEEKRA